MSLVNKLRAAREKKVKVGEFEFVIRRPTDVEMMELGRRPALSHFLRFIVGWEGVKEMDLIPGGDPHPLPFDPDVAAEWLSDRSDLLTPLYEAISSSYRAHAKEISAKSKN